MIPATLRGRISWAAVALSLALCFAGCRTTQSPREQVKDDTITAQVKSEMAKQISITSVTDIDVNTTNGVVTLAGQVQNDDAKQHAEQIARAVPGVVAVNNNLQVAASGLRR